MTAKEHGTLGDPRAAGERERETQFGQNGEIPEPVADCKRFGESMSFADADEAIACIADILEERLLNGVTHCHGLRWMLRKLQAEAAAAPRSEAAGAQTRFAWLLEKTIDGEPAYWDGGHAESFTRDPNRGVQFARKEDALLACKPQHYAQWEWNYVEHGFMVGAAAPRSAPEQQCLNTGSAIGGDTWKREPACLCKNCEVVRRPRSAPGALELFLGAIVDQRGANDHVWLTRCAVENLEALRASPGADHCSAAPVGWQPIETAPKDRRVAFWVVPKTAEESYTDTSGKPIVSPFNAYPRQHFGKHGTWSSLEKAILWHELPPDPPALSPAGVERKE